MNGAPAADSVGKTYGKLTVLRVTRMIKYEPTKSQPYGSSVAEVECQCECGKVKTLLLNNVKSGATTDCGHTHIYQVGDIVGRFTVLVGSCKSNRRLTVQCSCCQHIKTIAVSNFLKSAKQKCRCQAKHMTYVARVDRWQVYIKRKYIGYYKTQEEAQWAIDQHMKEQKQ